MLVTQEGGLDQKETVSAFYRAFHESKFLFPPKSGVRQHVDEIRERAAYITNFSEILRIARDGNEGSAASLKKLDHVNWILGATDVLEKRMVRI